MRPRIRYPDQKIVVQTSEYARQTITMTTKELIDVINSASIMFREVNLKATIKVHGLQLRLSPPKVAK